MDLKIKQELKDLIPPLQSDEYQMLQQSLKNEGCRDKLLTWNGYIIDGHNRYEICKANNIEFKAEEVDFESIEKVKVWMIDNQKGRRNLTDGWKWELAQVKRNLLKNKGRDKQNKTLKKGNETPVLSKKDNTGKHNTQKEVAKELGWGSGKVARAEQVWSKGDEQLKEKVKSGDISIGGAYNEIKKKEKKQEKQENFKRKKSEFEKDVKVKSSKYNCYNGSCIDYLESESLKDIDLVLTDPPYAMDFKSGWNDWDKIAGDKRNDTSKLLDDCFKLCQKQMKDDAHIYVFGNPNEIEVVKPIFEKYFNLKNMLIWDRQVIGMGDLKSYGRSYDVIYFGYNKTFKELNGTRERDVLNYKRVSPNELIHPTEKPDDILQYLIKKSSKENDIVFDPFAGSCSTIRNAYELNRNGFGCELESKYIPEWILK